VLVLTLEHARRGASGRGVRYGCTTTLRYFAPPRVELARCMRIALRAGLGITDIDYIIAPVPAPN
jgi:hypothetical protein